MALPFACPNRPPCSHSSFVHDVEDDEDETPRCCVEDCNCGARPDKEAPAYSPAKMTDTPIDERRWRELQTLAWSPEFKPPDGTPDQVRHDALRDAVREAERLRGQGRSNWPTAQALMQVLADHRVMMRQDGGQTPKLITDLMQWAATTVEHETHRLRALADERGQMPDITDGITDAEAEASGTFDLTIDEVRSLKTDRDALAARVAELERALADVDMTFRLPDGGGWCATCRLPMREGRTVVKTLAVVCEPCAAGLAVTAGRLDPTRLAARKAGAATASDGQDHVTSGNAR